MASGNFIRTFRQLTLFVILIMVAIGSYMSHSQTTSWEDPLWVTVYPIDADASAGTGKYIQTLTPRTFKEIERFMVTETSRYDVEIDRPVRIDIGEPIAEQPPAPPASRNPLSVVFWSLKIRWWARSVTSDQPGARPNVRMFVVYHDPKLVQSVPHSLGLQKGLLGVVHAFADRDLQGQNNVIIAHEMLHTLGATDKYAPETNLPIHPAGYADPDRNPLYPQKLGEIMGGRIPVSSVKAIMPRTLKQIVVGTVTAAEINWIK
jgi:hypothetical protein